MSEINRIANAQRYNEMLTTGYRMRTKLLIQHHLGGLLGTRTRTHVIDGSE